MAGLLFDYFDGYLRVGFQHAEWVDDINLVFSIYGDSVAVTPCSSDFQKGEFELEVAESVQLHCWTSATLSHFFRSMVCWLEAVICDVHECAFGWDGEGPEGELRWLGGHDASGLLAVSWTGHRRAEAFSHRVRLNKRQMVQAFYQGFRDFVQSAKYDPIKYERLTLREMLDLGLLGGCEAAEQEILQLNRLNAYALVQQLTAFIQTSERKVQQRVSLPEVMQSAKTYWKSNSEEDAELLKRVSEMFPEGWNEWMPEKRQQHLHTMLDSSWFWGGFGERLRELHSPRLEAWLLETGDV